MSPIRREVINGLLVLILSTLLGAAIAAFGLKFNLLVWVLIIMTAAMAVLGYVVFKFLLSSEERETEWLKRIGTPARFEVGPQWGGKGGQALRDAVMTISPGTEYTVMYYVRRGLNPMEVQAREAALAVVVEQVRGGTIREYKRIICFDPEVLEGDQELKSGVLRVGEGPGTIDKAMGEHCRLIMSMKACSLFVAPARLQSTVVLYGSDKAAMTVETFSQDERSRTIAGILFFCEPPNGEIIEEFGHIERETERRMVAVHKIVFPEDAATEVKAAAT